MKLAMKRAMGGILRAVGPRAGGVLPRAWLAHGACRMLLDERTLPNELVARPLSCGGARLLCNPYVYTHRMPYWFGRLYEWELERYLRANVNAGDTVIDVGVNVGHVTVLCATLVGPSGRVYGFEVNPEMAQRTGDHCRGEGLNHVTLFDCGLGERDENAMLRLAEGAGGTNTLRDEKVDAGAPTRPVVVRRGDDVLAECAMAGRVMLKLDVEGYELPVLRGMPKLLAGRIDHAVIEVTPEWIGGAAGVAEMFGLMASHGFSARLLDGRHITAADVARQENVLFTKGGR